MVELISQNFEQREVQTRKLVSQAQCGDERAMDTLIRKYRVVAYQKARGYFLAEADLDDLRQEAVRAFQIGPRLSSRRGFDI